VGGDKDTLVPTQTHAASIGVDMQHFLERILCREEYLIGTAFLLKKMEGFWHLARHVHSPSFINSVVEAIFIFGIPLLRNKFEYVTS